VKASIAYCEASELARVSVYISATFYRSRDQVKLEELFVEETGVAAEIAK